jgi:hypothetical protein
MLFEEIIPHLNKLATVYLAGNRRKTGWIYIDSSLKNVDEEQVYFITVIQGRKLIEVPRAKDLEKLEKLRESIPLSEIVRIRSVA